MQLMQAIMPLLMLSSIACKLQAAEQMAVLQLIQTSAHTHARLLVTYGSLQVTVMKLMACESVPAVPHSDTKALSAAA